MKKKLLSENASCLYESLIEGLRVLEEQNEKLRDENIFYKGIEKKLEVSNKRNIRYENILNITPGANENKVELLEYFTNNIIPHISNKIESKYTSKIKEYLDKEILNKEKEEGEELYNLVVGTHLEFLFPYLYSGWLKIDCRALKSYIKNPSTLAYSNWKNKIFDIVKKSRENRSCPIYKDKDFGLHNPISFSDECVMDLSQYFLDCGYKKYVECIQDSLLEILESNKLKIKYGLHVNTVELNLKSYHGNPSIVRDTLWKYISNKEN
jgi:hypothetical protein